MSSLAEILQTPQGERVLRLHGVLALDDASRLRAELTAALDEAPVGVLDLGGVERMEGAAASVLADALCASGDPPRVEGAAEDVASIVALYWRDSAPERQEPRRRHGFIAEVGETTLELIARLRDMLSFVGQLSGALLAGLRRPGSIEWGAVGRQVERHGADGLPIVCVIGSLMGLITAFQAAIQLQKFGADAFVADLVSLSLTRELAPLMTAIVVAGRSGAAIAAEIGTMKVSEEVDALRTLGICPHRFLVFPRMFALLLVLPLLTLAGDLVGILSGALVATSTLEIGLRKFLMSTQEALVPADILGGMLKASVFGVFIAGIACERGLAARGGAEGVGRSTTSAVVSMLFWLVLLDALFAVFFNIWGIY
jgi:phospholipid/cholesterol/gamma-HCH transport system permease protein